MIYMCGVFIIGWKSSTIDVAGLSKILEKHNERYDNAIWTWKLESCKNIALILKYRLKI